MDDSTPLKTLLDLARHLGATSARTGRRALTTAMLNDPGLRVTMRGRTILLTPEQLARTLKALEWRSPSASAARSGTRAAPSASAGRRSPSPSSPRDAFLEKMRRLRQRPKRPASAGPE